jgi:hypothetical protein
MFWNSSRIWSWCGPVERVADGELLALDSTLLELRCDLLENPRVAGQDGRSGRVDRGQRHVVLMAFDQIPGGGLVGLDREHGAGGGDLVHQSGAVVDQRRHVTQREHPRNVSRRQLADRVPDQIIRPHTSWTQEAGTEPCAR